MAVVLADAVAAAVRLVATVAALVAAETADADPALTEFGAVPGPLLTAAARQ